MTRAFPPRRAAFWALIAATVAVYLAMVLWTLPRITGEAGGLLPFDLRPTGYSFDDARAFLAALSPEGTSLYLGAQHSLDSAYPALLAATLFFAILMAAPRRPAVLRTVMAMTAVPGMMFDYLENGAVARMLNLGTAGLTPEAVAGASRWTVLKSGFTSLAMLLLLVLLALSLSTRLFAALRRRRT